MYLIPFESLFPEIARKETRSLTFIGLGGIPNSDYGLLESYCPDPKCNCQRVMLNVLSRLEEKQVATISYGFDRSAKDAGPKHDPFNPQSPYAEALKTAIGEHLEMDHTYVLRLKAHYSLVKAAATDPRHPAQKVLESWRSEEQKLLETDDPVADLRAILRSISEQKRAFAALERRANQTAVKKRSHRSAGDGKKKNRGGSGIK